MIRDFIMLTFLRKKERKSAVRTQLLMGLLVKSERFKIKRLYLLVLI